MNLKRNLIRAATFCSLSMLMIAGMPCAASTPTEVQEKAIASKQSGNLIVVMTNEAGKLTPGENHFCVLFQSISPASAIDVREVTVDFRLLVGRIEEALITAHLSSIGAQRFCGRIDLGRQYYRPASYYAFVHYVEASGRKRSIRLHLAVK